MLSENFLAELKRTTEAKWCEQTLNPNLVGFQFQRGTRWKPGLPEKTIAEYENYLSIRFPNDFRAFLRVMNGTDLPTLNIYGSCGETPRESIGVYSYPRDIKIVEQRIEDIHTWRPELERTMAEQSFQLRSDAALMPIYIHRYVVCGSDLGESPVLSIHGATDAIVYGHSLGEYLEKEFVNNV